MRPEQKMTRKSSFSPLIWACALLLSSALAIAFLGPIGQDRNANSSGVQEHLIHDIAGTFFVDEGLLPGRFIVVDGPFHIDGTGLYFMEVLREDEKPFGIVFGGDWQQPWEDTSPSEVCMKSVLYRHNNITSPRAVYTPADCPPEGGDD